MGPAARRLILAACALALTGCHKTGLKTAIIGVRDKSASLWAEEVAKRNLLTVPNEPRRERPAAPPQTPEQQQAQAQADADAQANLANRGGQADASGASLYSPLPTDAPPATAGTTAPGAGGAPPSTPPGR